MTFAPAAGANGVDPLEPAPIVHAMNKLAIDATKIIARTLAETINPVFPGVHNILSL
jgi:hypothetical protein